MKTYVFSYSPPDFLGGKQEINKSNYKISLENGKASAYVDETCSDDKIILIDAMAEDIERALIIRQMTNFPKYEFNKSRIDVYNEEGGKGVFINAKDAPIEVKTGVSGCLKKRDKNGKVIYDSRLKEKQDEKYINDCLAAHGSDNTLNSICNSFHNAMQSPENELVRLYEMRDALSTKFGGKDKSCKNLGISEKDWDELGVICNAKPIDKSRHRGKHIGNIRKASDNELNKAREIAKKLILSYCKYLNGHGP